MLNHYQKDILFIALLIGLQLIFTYFYPFQNPDTLTPIEVSRRFIMLEFHFQNSGETTTYIPFLSIIYACLLILLIVQKRRRFALIYGFAVVLVAKVSFLIELYGLEGVYSNLYTKGLISQKIIADDQVIAQDLTLYILGVLLFIKSAIYLHDHIMVKKGKVSEFS